MARDRKQPAKKQAPRKKELPAVGAAPTSKGPAPGPGAGAGSTARRKPGPKGKLKLDVRLQERDERIARLQFALIRERFGIDEGNGPLPPEEVRRRLPLPTLADLDTLVLGEPDLSRGVSPTDTRKLREILGRRSGKLAPPQPPVSAYPVGEHLSNSQRVQFARDIVEVLDLANALLLDPCGRIAAFPYELAAVERLHELSDANRARRAFYKERARMAQMLLELHGIYDRTSTDWTSKKYDAHSGGLRLRPKSNEISDRERAVMEEQRTALRDFCARFDLAESELVPLLEQDGIQIRESEGAAKTAAQALETVFKRGEKTIDAALDISPLEITRATRKPLVDSVLPDALDAYDETARVLREVFTLVTRSAWPWLNTHCQVPGWPRMRGDALVALGWRAGPLRSWPRVRPRYWFRRPVPKQRHKQQLRALQEQLLERPRKMLATGEADAIVERFVAFLLKKMSNAPRSTLVRELIAEFQRAEADRK